MNATLQTSSASGHVLRIDIGPGRGLSAEERAGALLRGISVSSETFGTEAEAAEAARAFPRYVGVKVIKSYGMRSADPVRFGLSLRVTAPDGASGSANETGARRLDAFLRVIVG